MTQSPEQKKDYSLSITGSIIGLNLLLMLWGLFEPVITYVPGSEGPGPAFHYTLNGGMLIIFMMLCNVILGAFFLIVASGITRQAVRDFFTSASRAFFLSIAVVLLVGFPSCFIGEDLARNAGERESVGN